MKKLAVKVNCPDCGGSLMDNVHLINNKESIKLNIEVPGGEKGVIWLSSVYGDYNYSSDTHLPDDEVIAFFCPHCNKNLKRKKVECENCGAPIISFRSTIGARISICSRHGCKNHYVVLENPDIEIQRFYEEYGFH
jgi:predicted RNA-binding Zn-ribbon protein involved in translation (DUF1610 family)